MMERIRRQYSPELKQRIVQEVEAGRLSLREAARVGMADMDAGRFRSFESPAALSRGLAAIADKAIGRAPARRSK